MKKKDSDEFLKFVGLLTLCIVVIGFLAGGVLTTIQVWDSKDKIERLSNIEEKNHLLLDKTDDALYGIDYRIKRLENKK